LSTRAAKSDRATSDRAKSEQQTARSTYLTDDEEGRTTLRRYSSVGNPGGGTTRHSPRSSQSDSVRSARAARWGVAHD